MKTNHPTAVKCPKCEMYSDFHIITKEIFDEYEENTYHLNFVVCNRCGETIFLSEKQCESERESINLKHLTEQIDRFEDVVVTFDEHVDNLIEEISKLSNNVNKS